MDVMLDLETLSTGPTAAIVQIGAVLFEPRSGGKILNDKGFRQSICEPVGDIDGATLRWWLAQPDADKLAWAMSPDGGGCLLAVALEAFRRWPGECGHGWDEGGCVWAKPSNFDLPILDHAHRICGLSVPWRHWETRCARTLFALVGAEPQVDRTGFQRHDALDDATVQAMQVQKALGK